jgi:hypothetical protein
MPGVAFPLVGRLGLTSPPSPVLCAAKTAILPLSERFACRSRPDTLPAPVVRGLRFRLVARWKPPGATPGLLSQPAPQTGNCCKETGGSPKFLSYPYGDMPRSQTPVVSWALAMSRPGRLPSGQWKPSAFPLPTALRDILRSTTIHISGLHHAACLLAPSSSVLPLLGVHVEFAPDLVARLWSGGT